MTIRSQELDSNALLLYPLGKGVGANQGVTPVFAPPQDDEDSDGGQGSALRDDEEKASDLKLALQADAKSKLTNDLAANSPVKGASGTSADPVVDPTILPAGYGAAIVAAFLAMIKYLNEMSQQGYQVTAFSANAMIGTDGNKGLIQSWVDAGMLSAQSQGDSMMDEAWGQLISGIVCGASFIGTGVGFVRNSTTGIATESGIFQTNYGKISADLEDAQSYREMLNSKSGAERVAQSASENVLQPNQAARNLQANGQAEQPQQQVKVELDTESEALKKEMTKRANENYKSNKNDKLSQKASEENENENERSEAKKALAENARIKLAADHMGVDEKIAAKEKADKRIENLQSQLAQCENKQQSWGQTLNIVTQAGTAGGTSYGKWTGSQDTIEGQKQKTTSDAIQQTSQTTESVKEKANQQSQTDREQMSQMAQAMAQALASQTQSRA